MDPLELARRYESGERDFHESDLRGADLIGLRACSIRGYFVG
jgi:hypothetical protein